MNKDNMDELKKEYDNIEVPPELDLAIERGIKKGKAYKRKIAVKSLAAVAACLFLTVGTASGIKFFNPNNTSLTQTQPNKIVGSSKTLPVVGSSENLQKLLKNYIVQNNYGMKSDMAMGNNAAISAEMPQSTVTEKSSSDSGRETSAMANKSGQSNATDAQINHSTTNLQVQGVDEEDLVKTDGEYIFKVNAQKIINVIKVGSDSKMEAINNITFEENYNISGIYLNENILVVVGNSYQNIDTQKDSSQSNKSYMMQSNEVTKVISFDISDKKNIKKVRDIEVDGFYSSSRMIGPRVYIVANKYLNNIGNIKQDEDIGKAYYSDSAVGKDKITIEYNTIKYLPDSIEPNYIMVASYNVSDNKEKVKISTILGSGNSIYSSDKNLYIAGNKYAQDKNNGNTNTNTIIYKFAYEDTGVKFVSSGEVPGTITNQFSMDERNDYFRIATTEYKYSTVAPMTSEKSISQSNGSTTSVSPVAPSTDIVAPDQKMSNQPQNQITNNLFILDKDMKLVGKLQGLANGEQIYSVRFMNDRAYIVTFMMTDPLFVIDLKNPTSPKVLGELKIPGFTNYLHPYDETHLIGFGMDSTVINEGGMDRAKTKGMKIAIFDVSDVSKPVQQFMTTIGGAGTYSEVLNNHKALLFSKGKNLLALPVTENNYNYDNNTNISEQSYQGAYIYNIDLVNGIKLKGKITHMDEDDNSNKNNSTTNNYEIYPMFNGQYFVDRILYIKDTLYTLSNGLIKANDINTLKEKSKLKLKTVDLSKVYPTDGVREVIPSPAP
ncbi:MAG: inhibitor of cysteine peptidase [Clostridium sp.]|jgi:inhibitor of cysteine peptidase